MKPDVLSIQWSGRRSNRRLQRNSSLSPNNPLLSLVSSGGFLLPVLLPAATLSSARNPHSVFGDAALKWSQVHSGRKHWLGRSQREAGGEERSRMFACQNANISAKRTCWHLETVEKRYTEVKFLQNEHGSISSFQVFPQWFCVWRSKRLQLFCS